MSGECRTISRNQICGVMIVARVTRLLAILLGALVLVACFRIDQAKPLPETITAWIEQSRSMFLAQSKELDGRLYILVTYGEKPTGGYVVEIGKINVTAAKVTVPVRFKKPAPGEVVTQALTNPYDLETIAATNLPLEFVPAGDEEYLPTLIGIDELRAIVASSRGVKVFAPTPQGTVPRRFVLDGVANVFEGNVQYRLLDNHGRELDRGFTTGAMGDWGYFRTELNVPEHVTTGARMLLDVFTTSAKDGSINEQIFIELVLR